jgi:hypothetical protein
MTAKEKLRQAVEKLSEAEAEDALGYIVQRRGGDALSDLLDTAPIDDEPTTLEEDKGVREARDELARGEAVSAEDIKREIA